MATDTERFASKFRKDRYDARRERTERRNKGFDTNDSTDVKETVTRSTVSVSVRSSARPAATSSARSEASKLESGKSELESVTSRINRLKVNDDKDGPEETTTRHDDSNEEGDHEKKHHIERKERGAGATTSKKRQQRKNLREKRRSTGVVIMPNMEVFAIDIYIDLFCLNHCCAFPIICYQISDTLALARRSREAMHR